MIPVIGIVGTSNSGKTTLICRVVADLSARGYRVATIKHHHGEFDIDHEGKDSYKHREAGAETVLIASPNRVAMVRKLATELPLQELVGTLVDDVDLVIVEGYKGEAVPKIEVWREGQPDETMVCRGDPDWVALVTDFPHDVEVPVLDLNWPAQVADFIESNYLKGDDKSRVRLVVDGNRIELNRFAEQTIANVVRGAIASLKGCENPARIRVDILPEEK